MQNDTDGGRTLRSSRVGGRATVPGRVAAAGVEIGGNLLGTAAIWYLFAEAVAAVGFPGYSYAHNWISDLGIPERGEFQGRLIDSRLADVMNAGFIGHGLLLILGFVVLSWSAPRLRAKPALLGLALVHGFGIALVGLVHGSQANATAGLIGFHFAGAFMAIVGGNLLLIVAGARALRTTLGARAGTALVVLGLLGIASVVMLVISQATGAVLLVDYGVWERGSVYTVMVGELVIAATLLRRRPAPATSD